jgi:hypothetical protein
MSAPISKPQEGQGEIFCKPPPEGVIEEVVGLGINTLVERKDGSLLANNGRVSTDGGVT